MSSQNGSNLRTNQRKAIEVFMTGGTVKQAAAAANVTERTVYGWKTEDAFKSALKSANDELLTKTTNKLSAASVDVVDILLGIAGDKKANVNARVNACKAILDYSFKSANNTSGLEQELADLKDMVNRYEQSLREAN